MSKWWKSLLVILGVTSLCGCAQNHFNVPQETFEKKVRVLGVAPILVDADSDIRHPKKDELVALVKESNRKNEKQFVGRLKETGDFFSVRLVDADPDQLFQNLFFRRERRDDAGVEYNKYFYKQQEIRDLLRRENVDAVMVMVVSGITRRDRIFSSNLLKYVDAEYNLLVLSAQIVDADGTILWEYPNFRQNAVSYPSLYALEYPDFDEASANLSDKVDIHFKTIEGSRRGFDVRAKDLLFRQTAVSAVYQPIFADMAALLKMGGTASAAKKEAPAAPGVQQ